MLLTVSFAQTLDTPQYRRSQNQNKNDDGQWHRFQNGGGANPGASGRTYTRPQNQRPQNEPGHAGNWLRRYKDLPPAQQRRALENDSQFRKLPPAQQARLRQRLQHFSTLPPDRQERILNRMETWEHLTPDQKQQARQVYQQFRQLPPPRRQAVNEAIRELRSMPPVQRDRFVHSEQYRYRFSPPERAIIEGASHLPLAPW